MEEFLRRVPLDLPILLDARGDVAAQYGTSRLPESFLIDPRGIVVEKYLGPRDWDNPKIVAEIGGHLDGS